MKLLDLILTRKRMVLTTAFTLALVGVAAWVRLPRQEDPEMRTYWGNIIVSYPGADTKVVERLIVDPIEEQLAEVEEIREWVSTSNQGFALMRVEMASSVENMEDAWDEVREAMARAELEFPQGASDAILKTDLDEQDSAVIALTGGNDNQVRYQVARKLKRRLLDLNLVSAVRLYAEPGEQITISYDDVLARRLGIDPNQLASTLAQRNVNLSGGSLKLGDRIVNVRPHSEFTSIEEIKKTPVLLPSGKTIPLEEIAEVRFGPREPVRSYARYNGADAIVLGVVPREGSHLMDFGDEVRQLLEEIREQLTPMQTHLIEFHPDRVQHRLNNLGQSLVFGIFIVAIVLLFVMGLRMGLVVSSVVPLVTFSGLAVYGAGGGMLHQISISSLVLALGMLVDNAIVMAESVQWHLDRGTPPHRAAIEAIRELAIPLASATGTTIAAFIPMLLADGTTAEFTRSIPVIIMVTLSMSYLFAIFVTPALSELFLRRRGGVTHKAATSKLAQSLASISLKRAPVVIIVTMVIMGATFFGAGFVGKQFFPYSDRNQLIVELKMADGTHVDGTDRATRLLERELLDYPNVSSVSSFVGRGLPHFYYNLPNIPFRPHLGQLVVNTKDLDTTLEVYRFVRTFAAENMPDVQVTPRRLEQGPPVNTPIEIRVLGNETETLYQVAETLRGELRRIEGAVDIRDTLSLGAPSLNFIIDDAAAARRGLSRQDVALALYGRTRGLPVTWYRAGEDPVPIVLRSSEGEHFPVEKLATVDVSRPGGPPVPVSQIASVELEWLPASIQHYNRRRMIKVTSMLAPGYTYSDVQPELMRCISEVTWPKGIELQFGGEAEGSGEANESLLNAMPWGMLLLFSILLAQFNSFRRVAIVLVTVPLAAAGVVPGLLISNQPFGFMSLLGVIALIGVVVNNAIVLLDVIESRRKEGASIAEAVKDAVARRTRPILLTTATTVGGMLPLAFSEASLWPPLAWSMISGLVASTLLTLLVAPSLYVLMFRASDGASRSSSKVGAPMVPIALFAAVLLSPQVVRATEPSMTLEQALHAALTRPSAQAAQQRAHAADLQAEALRRGAILPGLGIQGRADFRENTGLIQTPIGDVVLGEKTSYSVDGQLVQPIFKPSELLYATPAAHVAATATHFRARETRLRLAAEAVRAFFDVAATDARLRATDSFIRSLEKRLSEAEARVAVGRTLKADVLKVQLDLDAARLDAQRLRTVREVSYLRLGQAVNVTGPVAPAFDPDLSTPPLPDLGAAIDRGLNQRPELNRLQMRVEELALRAKAVGAEWLPILEASATWSWRDGDPFLDGSNISGALQLSWRPFQAATRRPRQAALQAEQTALAAEIIEHKRLIAVQIREAHAAIDVAQAAVGVAERGVELAGETLRVERERHSNGRATTNDLLAAEARLREQQTKRDVAQIELLKSHLQLQLTMGVLPIP